MKDLHAPDPQECARVYVTRTKTKEFTIQCIYCNANFICCSTSAFAHFLEHLEQQHLNLTSTMCDETKNDMNAEFIVLPMNKNEVLAELPAILFEGETLDTLECDKLHEANTSRKTYEHQNDPQPVDGKDVSPLESTEHFFSGTTDTEAMLSQQERPERTRRFHKYSRVADGCERSFFSFRKTPKRIMIDFIEIVRRHPCHWDPNDPGYGFKDRRDESAAEICHELRAKWDINIRPQIARSSVLHICNWFKRESLRFHRDEEKQMMTLCLYPDYYNKLSEFMPPTDAPLSIGCGECQRTFKSEPHLLSHKYHAHKGQIPYKCQHCGRGFVHQSSLRHHENRHTKERIWPCSLCEYRGVTKTDYQLHKMSHSDIRPFVCDLCQASYKSSTSLNVHRRTHEPPKLQCPICGKKMYENYRFKKHMQRHKQQSPSHTSEPVDYKCTACDILFVSKKSYEKHILITHEISGDEEVMHEYRSDSNEQCITYPCTVCGIEFLSGDDLSMHSLTMHELIIF